MPSERTAEPWAGSTYNGFSGGPAGPGAPEPPPRGPRPPISRKTLIFGGVAVAVALGLAFGLWARPQRGPDGRSRDTLGASAEAATAPMVPIEVNRPQPLPTPTSTGRMEVLPAEMAQQARANAPAALPRRAETGLPQDAAAISPEVQDPPEMRWAPPEQRLSRAERRALREQRWAEEDAQARDEPRFAPDEPPPPEEDGDLQ
jgi:hypothetical protein